jgi:hypothetical protein
VYGAAARTTVTLAWTRSPLMLMVRRVCRVTTAGARLNAGRGRGTGNLLLACWHTVHEAHLQACPDLLSFVDGVAGTIPSWPDVPVGRAGVLSQSPPVAAPEWHLHGQYTRASDWFALGQLLYHICCAAADQGPASTVVRTFGHVSPVAPTDASCPSWRTAARGRGLCSTHAGRLALARRRGT